MIVHGSIADDAFTDAESFLAGASLDPIRRRPAFDLVIPPAPSTVPWSVPAAWGGPIARAGHALRSGERRCVDLVAEAIARVEAVDDTINAIVTAITEQALLDAARLDGELARGADRGPLHGIPITVKDVIDVEHVPTRCGSAAYCDVPTADADAVARLREAGAIVLAKVSTHEFALGVTSPQSGNPHDPTRIPGGSSGGSAAAVASGIGLGSLGTDTRASIRVPAALSGVVGLKPTYGTVPTRGVVSLSWTMDHVAVMGTTVGDAARMLGAIGGLVELAPVASAPLAIGVPAAAFEGADPALEACVRAAIGRLSALGHPVVEVDSPGHDDFTLAGAAGLVVSRAEAAAFHRSLGLDRDLYWDEVADQLRRAESMPAIDYVDAQRHRALLGDRMAGVFGRTPILAMPTVPVTAPPRDEFAGFLMLLARNAIPWSFLGVPAISLPCGIVDGLPVGLQLVAGYHREPDLLQIAAALEATDSLSYVPEAR